MPNPDSIDPLEGNKAKQTENKSVNPTYRGQGKSSGSARLQQNREKEKITMQSVVSSTVRVFVLELKQARLLGTSARILKGKLLVNKTNLFFLNK